MAGESSSWVGSDELLWRCARGGLAPEEASQHLPHTDWPQIVRQDRRSGHCKVGGSRGNPAGRAKSPGRAQTFMQGRGGICYVLPGKLRKSILGADDEKTAVLRGRSRGRQKPGERRVQNEEHAQHEADQSPFASRQFHHEAVITCSTVTGHATPARGSVAAI